MKDMHNIFHTNNKEITYLTIQMIKLFLIFALVFFTILLPSVIEAILLHWLSKYWNEKRTWAETIRILLYSIVIITIFLAEIVILVITKNDVVLILLILTLPFVVVCPWQFIKKYYHITHGRAFLLLVCWVIVSSFASGALDISVTPIVERMVNPYMVAGSANEPQLSDNDYILASKFFYKTSEPQRGDIIVFTHPHTEEIYIMRIIGLPRERVELKSGRVFVDDKQLDEPYLAEGEVTCGTADQSSCGDENKLFEIPENAYFVLGDNRDRSADSRTWHDENNQFSPYLMKSNILGKAWIRIYPKINWIE